MDEDLPDETEYQKLLNQREKPLTAAQKRELREIDRTAMKMKELSNFSEIGDSYENINEDVWQSLRNQQREILTDEKMSILERLALFIPEKVGFNLG